MSRKFQAVKGTRDILPPESLLWNQVEQTARQVFAAYNFHEVRLPIFERTELFVRSIGGETDIVSKEMYTFPVTIERTESPEEVREIEESIEAMNEPQPTLPLGSTVRVDERGVTGPFLSLRPEATASVVRAYIEHGMQTWPQPVKLYYIGPMFRRERPQKGRFRQFYQIGAEVLGPSDAPAIDAEVIELVWEFIGRCGLKGATLYLNSLGCAACRPKYVEKLRGELEKVRDRLGPDSQRRIETNPLRVLDSKVEGEQPIIEKLPTILDHLCDACRGHFADVQRGLEDRGIRFEINQRLVRGLDYYMRTTFEITAPGLGAQNAVCGGGRYDGLVELLGGPPTKGIGWALGTDRFLLALESARKMADAPKLESRLDVFVIWLGASTYGPARDIARKLRDAGASVELAYEEAKLKKALGRADQLHARYALILGEKELAENKFALREMQTGTQRALSEAELLRELKPRMHTDTHG